MRIFGYELTLAPAESKASTTLSLNQLLERLEAVYETVSGIAVTPETALQSPTVHACVRAIASYISTLPVHVVEETVSRGRTSKERLPDHSVARLLQNPNLTQDRVTYWLDATSWLVRYGNHYAYKGRGVTGPIRRLESLPPSAVTVEQDESLDVTYRVSVRGGAREYDRSQIHHARLGSLDGVVGASPIMAVREAIALEIAVEQFGASFFANGATPLLIFKTVAAQGFKTPEQRQKFIDDFHAAYGQRKRFRGLLMPHGIETADPVQLNNEHAQFLETRKLQRTIIAGALGVPPHKVGDLERATFNNVEQQDIDFVQSAVLPYVRVFEAAMERDLLTPADRAGGIKIRFNINGALRGDFKTQQEGLKIAREGGAVNANEWREVLGLNPRKDPGGDTYWDRGPSGQQGEPAPGGRPAQRDGEPDDDPAAPALAGRNGGGR